MDRNLFEASLTGNVQVLNSLLQEDELTLERVSLTCFNETPLHIASLRGHLDFMKILLHQKPTLAMSLDSLRRIPLHLASTEGHVMIVRELLQVMNPEACHYRDQDGRTSLHLAAMNEQVKIINILIQTNHNLSQDLLENGETILHTCISYNRFEALKSLSQLWNEEELAKLIDHNGNTLLHLAVLHKQIQAVKYLLQKSSFIANGNAVNGYGFTALDVLDHCLRDFGTLEIQTLLMEADILRAKTGESFQTSIESKSSQNATDLKNKTKVWTSRIWIWYLGCNGNWLEKQRGILILATIVVAAVSFYTGIYPPGGTFSDSRNGPLGNAVQTEVDMETFSSFLTLNTIMMVMSLTILMVLLSGIPLRNKFCFWVLNIASLCIVFVMTIIYSQQIAWMSPEYLGESYYSNHVFHMDAAMLVACIYPHYSLHNMGCKETVKG